VLQSLVTRVLASETVYTLTVEPLLPVLLELQRYNALVQKKRKVIEAERAARVTRK
jgi:hypothetical protein